MILGCMLRGHQRPSVGTDSRLFIKNVGIIHGERGGLNMRVALHRVITRNVEPSDSCHSSTFEAGISVLNF
jgi:hypothetical protein